MITITWTMSILGWKVSCKSGKRDFQLLMKWFPKFLCQDALWWPTHRCFTKLPKKKLNCIFNDKRLRQLIKICAPQFCSYTCNVLFNSDLPLGCSLPFNFSPFTLQMNHCPISKSVSLSVPLRMAPHTKLLLLAAAFLLVSLWISIKTFARCDTLLKRDKIFLKHKIKII